MNIINYKIIFGGRIRFYLLQKYINKSLIEFSETQSKKNPNKTSFLYEKILNKINYILIKNSIFELYNCFLLKNSFLFVFSTYYI
ncbi:MAG: hypothetical protein A2086_08980 [Spirochaetes bacterium GWD1_27_9]|nr:MAG: hypothetical protein A2Z98_05595 [Spirochaetes bacterium GWB1_27_13]OHD44673.1 MAG: hypothetical protein A2086_08980 [Spirochaetes bacterium GWD1_27_9]